MNITVLTSSVLWPILLLLWIGLFINSKYYKNTIEHLTDRSHTLIFVWILGMILWSYMVSNNNIFDWKPEIIISIIWWGILLKSSLILALPTTFTELAKKIDYDINAIKTVWIICIVLWLYLLNFAYFGLGYGI